MSLQPRRLDLHTHTPASHDFLDKTVTAEQIIKKALSTGLDGIAVTDHNTVDFIDKLKQAAKDTKLTIFPGMEISCGGTREGSIHVIALFDPSCQQRDLERVLGKLEVKGSGEAALTNKSVNDVIDIISEAGGLAVLAHANSIHGALTDIRGNPRTEIVRNPNLLAVEATAGDFAKPANRLIDILNGTDPTYQRKVAVYQASDNPAPGGHGVDGIGRTFTCFKMGEMSLDSLRQCFEDPDSRIIQSSDSEKLADSHPRLMRLEVDGGFLDSQKLSFSSNMNSIIGGTGTGKSLVIEFIRFGLSKPPSASAILADHKEKLQKRLGTHGKVSLVLRDTAGEEYEISRTLASPKDPYSSPVECINRTTGKKFAGDLNTIFPTLIYSQNEILEITRDPKAQLQLLENFRDFGEHKRQIAEIVEKLKKLDSDLAACWTEAKTIETVAKQTSTLQEQLTKIERGLKGKVNAKVLTQFSALEKERKLLLRQIEGYDELLDEITNCASGFADDGEGKIDNELESKLAKEIARDVQKTRKDTIAQIGAIRESVVQAKRQSLEKVQAWEKKVKYAGIEKTYKAEIKKKSALQEKEAERINLGSEKQKYEAKLTKAEKAKERLSLLRDRRVTLLDELKRISQQYSSGRAQQAELITNRSGGKLQVTIKSQTNTSKYSQLMMRLKIGSRAERPEIESLIEKVPADKLVENVLDGDTKSLTTLADLSEQMAKNIVSELTKEENLLATLALQYQGQAEDEIEIKYRKKDNNHYPLSELSMGQKADALIMIALGDGAAPVIIDQPEDALDIPSIWADVCSRIRPVKHGRQFVFTTHNSSISVASDSDQFTVLEADGNRGWVSKTGSIDQKAIRDEIIGHLEGGYDSYHLKRRKYRL